MTDGYALFISAIKAFLKDEKSDTLLNADGNALKKLFELSYAYDVLPIIYYAAVKSGVKAEEEYFPLITEGYFRAISRAENLSYDLSLIKDALNLEKVPFIPLKGAVMRSLYKEPFFRTSSDIDVLVKKEDLPRADKAFTQKLSFKFMGGTGHDRLYESPSGTQVELHYSLIEDGMAGKSYEILQTVWEHSEIKSENEFLMDEGFFCFYHIAHMAKHFENGTLGIRPFIDLYILEKNGYVSAAKEFLKDSGLNKFTDCALSLTKAWFDGAPHGELTETMESFIFGGGVFGNAETKMSVEKRRAGGKNRYILKRIFLPYEKLKNYYPNLERRKWLLPFYQIKRWFRLTFRRKRKVASRDLKLAKTVSEDKGEKLYDFCKKLDIGR